nr:hypothetical protein [Tanacetum cinerariifolium]
HDMFMLEFDGSTTIRKVSAKGVGFGQSLRVTLWGGVGDSLIEKKTAHVRMCTIVLTSMTAKAYNNKLYLSSTSSTVIYDNDDIPSLQELKSVTSLVKPKKEMMMAYSSQPRERTVENLLLWARNRKNDTVTFQCKVMIEDIRRKSGWNYPSCGGEKCRKSYRLEVVIADDTVQTIIVMFNEIASELLNCSADSLIEAEDEDDSGLPTAIRNLIGTTHVMELK